MQVLKRKILIEDSVDRTVNSPTYGTLTATSFYIKVMITQNMDDMGIFTDFLYIPNDGINQNPADYTILTQKLAASGITFPFMLGITPSQMTGLTGTNALTLRLSGSVESDYYDFGNFKLSAATDTKIEDVRSYNAFNPFRVGFNTDAQSYLDYANTTINGVNRVSVLGEPTIYVFDANDDSNLGTSAQNTGLLYQDYTGKTRNVMVDGQNSNIPLTTVSYLSQGWNQTNVSLSALTKEEYLFGITTPPEVESDVFIDRGATTVMEKHLKLSEVRNLDDLAKYGNGFYNLTKI